MTNEYYNMTLAEFGERFSIAPETLLSEVENWFGSWEMEKFIDNLIRTYDLDISEFEEKEVEEDKEDYSYLVSKYGG